MTARGTTPVDAVDLRRRLRRTERARKVRALALIAPLLLFVVVNFVAPVGIILFKSVDDREVTSVLPRTTRALAGWDGEGVPGEDAFAALFADVREAQAARTLVTAARRLNSDRPGFLALLSKTGRELPGGEPESYRAALVEIDQRWDRSEFWAAIKRTSDAITPIYLLAAFDLSLDAGGEVVPAPEYRRVFLQTWIRTLWMSAVITLYCVVIGYPLAYLLANVPSRVGNLLLILVLVPFWTSLLARTTAWLVLLQTQGVVNDVAIALNLWSQRVQLIHNRFGVYVTMMHILLPYVVLPLYGIMKRIPASYLRAAKSLGANPLVAFHRIYLPLTVHGVGAGALFVFVLAMGFYVTPALVGGRDDQMISYFIAFFSNEVLNWGQAAALSAVLLAMTAGVFYLFKLAFGLDRLQVR